MKKLICQIYKSKIIKEELKTTMEIMKIMGIHKTGQ